MDAREKTLAYSSRWRRAVFARANEIGPIRPVRCPGRKALCRQDLAEFLREYFPKTYTRSFSEDHLRAVAKLEEAILRGGLFVEAVYRGFGKTSLVEGAALWASLYGFRKYICIVGASAEASEEIIDGLKMELQTNDRLADDFPEVCQPVEHHKGISQRCIGQTSNGKPTSGEWSAGIAVFPTIEGAASSGSILVARSITGRLRGMKRKLPDGRSIRPDFVVCDDPQTDESAASPTQVEKRLSILNKTILNLGGHDEKISVVVPGTVIQRGDFMDQLLDHSKNPAWATERLPLVKSFSDNHKTWLGEYADLRRGFDPSVPGADWEAAARATAFYQANREVLDAGARVSWPECYDESEVSAIQHAYNKLIDLGIGAFMSEFQNEPLDIVDTRGQLTRTDFIAALSKRKRGEVPSRAIYLTAFVDVMDSVLCWAVCGWEETFTGYVVDYGAHPKQSRAYWTMDTLSAKLSGSHKGKGREGVIWAGLDHLVNDLCGREWPRDNGGMARIDRLLIDANDGRHQHMIRDFCRACSHPNVVLPYISRGVGAGDRPFSEYQRRPGERVGLNWRIPVKRGAEAMRHVLADVNFWKTFVRSRWKTAQGDVGNLSLFGGEIEAHQLFVDHMLSEFGVPVEGRGRKLEEWRIRNPRFQENHWWDCLVGCAVAASVCGATLKMEDTAQAVGAAGRYREVSGDELAALGGGGSNGRR